MKTVAEKKAATERKATYWTTLVVLEAEEARLAAKLAGLEKCGTGAAMNAAATAGALRRVRRALAYHRSTAK